jgi:hypothetical protein
VRALRTLEGARDEVHHGEHQKVEEARERRLGWEWEHLTKIAQRQKLPLTLLAFYFSKNPNLESPETPETPGNPPK